jgi:hypothetical protein
VVPASLSLNEELKRDTHQTTDGSDVHDWRWRDEKWIQTLLLLAHPAVIFAQLTFAGDKLSELGEVGSA